MKEKLLLIWATDIRGVSVIAAGINLINMQIYDFYIDFYLQVVF